MVQNAEMMHFSKGILNRLNGQHLVDLVNTSRQGPPGPAEEQEVLENTTGVIIWKDKIYQAKAQRGICTLNGSTRIINHILMF